MNSISKIQCLIGAASSGSGKTTFTAGLLRALQRKGLNVQPFKCGPDYIDTQYHTIASGNASVNLDSFLASEDHLRSLYARYGASADLCVTEGVMGLLDGYDGCRGSSAEIAALLGIPVVLVLNARSTAYSAAPVLYGFRHFCKELRIAGVVFNQVGSGSHFSFLKQACRDTGVECLGYLPKCKELEVPSRHLGLTLDERFRFGAFADRAADLVEKYVRIDRLLEVCGAEFIPDYGVETGSISDAETAPGSVPEVFGTNSFRKIAVARDSAFNFIYRENLARLERMGTVSFFSPLEDSVLPDADLLYLPGGYPEFFLDELSSNKTMRRQIRRYAEEGGRILAECGGMMYLCRSVVGSDGKAYPMCGALDLQATMEGMRLRLGYREMLFSGKVWRGHEFHYSRICGTLPSAARLYDARGKETETPLYRIGNITAGYTHWYWGERDISELFG